MFHLLLEYSLVYLLSNILYLKTLPSNTEKTIACYTTQPGSSDGNPLNALVDKESQRHVHRAENAHGDKDNP